MESVSNMDSLKAARRRRVAEEISDALKESGMTRKELAMAMKRQPSEVTKWLSGRHNFTSDLLEEISSVLGVTISGAKDTAASCTSLVIGYGKQGRGAFLNEPSACQLFVDLPESAANKLKVQAAEAAMTLREYVKAILQKKSEEMGISVMDLCGSCPDFPEADEIRAMRSTNTIADL